MWAQVAELLEHSGHEASTRLSLQARVVSKHTRSALQNGVHRAAFDVDSVKAEAGGSNEEDCERDEPGDTQVV